MISQSKQRGFTIVELLIVIVVIGILAAISIAAYTSITARAKTATAQASAKAVKDVAMTFNGSHGRFPVCKAEFTSGVGVTTSPCSGSSTTDPAVAKLPSDIIFASSVSASSTPKTVRVEPHGTTGFTITYWNFTDKAAKSINTGDLVGEAGTALSD